MGPIEMMYLIAGQRVDRELPKQSSKTMSDTLKTPEQLLELAEPHATRSVRIARQVTKYPASLETMRQRWRQLSFGLAAATPVLLLGVIGGSLIQTNSALVETLWEITAAGILLCGILIAIADSCSFYLKPLNRQTTPVEIEELEQLLERSNDAKAWHTHLSTSGRTPHQFDLEIMWALAKQELGKTKA